MENTERKEIRMLLNEYTFTNLCKAGFFMHNSPTGKTDVFVNRNDIRTLIKGEILTIPVGEEDFKIALQDIGFTMIREILKRSPLFSELAEEVNNY
jgi:hypothetical protein